MQNNGKGMSVAALVLGIVSIVLAWFYMINTIALVTGIVGIVLAVKGKKAAQESQSPTGMATAGLVLSIIGLCFAVIGFLSCTLCVLCTANAVAGTMSDLAYLS